jgi:hypothetical protein
MTSAFDSPLLKNIPTPRTTLLTARAGIRGGEAKFLAQLIGPHRPP